MYISSLKTSVFPPYQYRRYNNWRLGGKPSGYLSQQMQMCIIFLSSVYIYFCNTLNVFVNKVVDFLPGFVLFPFRWENDLFHSTLLFKFLLADTFKLYVCLTRCNIPFPCPSPIAIADQHLITLFLLSKKLNPFFIQLQAMNGLILSAVMKHSSNLIRLLIIACAMVVNTALSMAIFSLQLNLYFNIAFILVIVALKLYHS